MGNITKKVLGEVHGKIGDLRFYERDGKNIISTRPNSFMPGTDEKSINRRARFALAAKFSEAINDTPQIKYFWKKDKPEGLNSYNYIIRKNFPFVLSDSITSSAVLVPEFGFGVTASSVSIAPASVSVELNPVGHNNSIDPAVELNCQLSLIIYLSNPMLESYEPYTFINLVSTILPLDLDANLSFSITPESALQQLMNSYQDSFGYFSLITLGDNNQPVHYSTTFTS